MQCSMIKGVDAVQAQGAHTRKRAHTHTGKTRPVQVNTASAYLHHWS